MLIKKVYKFAYPIFDLDNNCYYLMFGLFV